LGNDKKVPKFVQPPPASGKRPRLGGQNPDAFYDLRPVWRLGRLDVACDPWGWNMLDGIILHRIRDRLKALETMTFRDVFKTNSHPIETWRLCNDAKKRLGEIGVIADELISLRVTGVERLWGCRIDSNVVELLWWDPLHQVYPVEKKHT
jgi:hypothetical protein